MSDYMLLEYLREKGIKGDEHKIINDFKKYMHETSKHKEGRKSYDYIEPDYEWDGYSKKKHIEGCFDEEEAMDIVSKMYHREGSKKHMGEHFDMSKAEEIYAKYKHQFVTDTSPEEIYVAINATYHDFNYILKSWFGTNIDDKIILMAITFWFKDEDYRGNKVEDYFKK